MSFILSDCWGEHISVVKAKLKHLKLKIFQSIRNFSHSGLCESIYKAGNSVCPDPVPGGLLSLSSITFLYITNKRSDPSFCIYYTYNKHPMSDRPPPPFVFTIYIIMDWADTKQ